ncbi:MAG: hypothetical protein K9H16_15770 [Bacteroidales bacterium]|nr:hypothetical protein [Bacteroidales bacterium]
MEHIAIFNLQNFSDEARKELKSFIDFLIYKYQINDKEKPKNSSVKKEFTALSIDTKGFKFNREEANER